MGEEEKGLKLSKEEQDNLDKGAIEDKDELFMVDEYNAFRTSSAFRESDTSTGSTGSVQPRKSTMNLVGIKPKQSQKKKTVFGKIGKSVTKSFSKYVVSGVTSEY